MSPDPSHNQPECHRLAHSTLMVIIDAIGSYTSAQHDYDIRQREKHEFAARRGPINERRKEDCRVDSKCNPEGGARPAFCRIISVQLPYERKADCRARNSIEGDERKSGSVLKCDANGYEGRHADKRQSKSRKVSSQRPVSLKARRSRRAHSDQGRTSAFPQFRPLIPPRSPSRDAAFAPLPAPPPPRGSPRRASPSPVRRRRNLRSAARTDGGDPPPPPTGR